MAARAASGFAETNGTRTADKRGPGAVAAADYGSTRNGSLCTKLAS